MDKIKHGKVPSKRLRLSDNTVETQKIAGKVKRIKLYNFMCHSHLEFTFGERINFLSGKNGSGKSAILTALVIGLGGRTSDTNRGHSLKNLIKNGQNAACIEITLHNTGDAAYNEEVYGDEITIIRKINEKTSVYKFLSENGKIITSKKNELAFILKKFNIQINNPICILNQDVARTFLKSTSPTEFYRLFRKGTLLEYVTDRINKFRSERLPQLNVLYAKHTKHLQESSKDLLEFKKKKEKQEELLKFEKEYEALRKELLWSYVLTYEVDITKEEKIVEEYKEAINNINFKVKKRDSAVNELKNNRKLLEEELNSIRNVNLENENAYLQKESEFAKTKELITSKMNEIKRFESKKSYALKNCQEIEVLIANKESQANEIEAKKKEMKLRKEELEKEYEELKAVLSTTEVHRQQLADTVNNYANKISHKKRFLDNMANTIKHKEQYLMSLKKGKNELSVYASWMPKFVEEIKSAYSKGKVEQMPRGPLGSYIKLKEEDWGPAIESLLGGGALRSFCVHSSHDYKVIDSIITKLNIPKQQRSSITISKFLSKVHDFSKKETGAGKYESLLRVLIISDPVIANSLIDQWQVEKVLLVPTNDEAYPLMEDITRVPVNCQRALTKTGDLFFPQPNYKSYSGTVNEHARFLQVNPENVIRLTENEIKTLREEYKRHQEEKQEFEKQYKSTREDLDKTERELKELTKKRATTEVKIGEIEQQDIPESFDVNVLSEDFKHWKGNISSCEQSIKEIEEEKATFLQKAKDLKDSLKELENKKAAESERLSQTEKKLSKVKSELQKVNQNHDYYITLLKSEERKYEGHQNKLEQLKKELDEAKKEAVETCTERIESPRDVNELKKQKTYLESMIKVLKKIVNGEIIEPADFELRLRNFEKTQTMLETQEDLMKTIEAVTELIPKKLEEISVKVGENTDIMFQKILMERNFLGKLEIDHANQRLNIIIKPDARAESDCPISTLSGGERSFSMVAFIIALWENMSSPFYFLDEFDVFMDEVNRKIVMDLLISFAKSRPQHQYLFLTPHSTVGEDNSPIINFFRMKDPRERTIEE